MFDIPLLQAIINGLMVGSIYVCISVGLEVIVGVLGLVTMAHGEFIMLGMYISYILYTFFNLPLYMIFIVVPLVFMLAAVPIYLGIIKMLVTKELSSQIFFTAGLSIVLLNSAVVIWKSTPRQLLNPYRIHSVALGPFLLNQALAIAFIFSIVATVLTFLFLYKTERGSLLRAIITNRKLISLIGLDPHRVYLQGFVLGMALTGFGAVLLSIYYPLTPAVGRSYGLYMWAALILGGVGTIKGCLIGGLIIGLIGSVSAFLLPTAFQDAAVLVSFIVITVIRPKGIFGGRL